MNHMLTILLLWYLKKKKERNNWLILKIIMIITLWCHSLILRQHRSHTVFGMKQETGSASLDPCRPQWLPGKKLEKNVCVCALSLKNIWFHRSVFVWTYFVQFAHVEDPLLWWLKINKKLQKLYSKNLKNPTGLGFAFFLFIIRDVKIGTQKSLVYEIKKKNKQNK